MKIAYCLFGVVGGLTGHNYDKTSGGDKVILESSNSLFKNTNCDNIDFFIHTWSTDRKDQLTSIYNPKKIATETQIIFNRPTHLPDIPRVQATYSRWYSAKQSIKLKRQYELEKNFKYDLVIASRLDTYWLKPINFNNLNNTKFNVSRSIVHGEVCGRIDGLEVEDIFLASNSEYIDQFHTMYDFLNEYSLPGQSPTWNYISSHFLIVWHLKKLNLWNTIDFPYMYWKPGYNNKMEDADLTLVRYIVK